MSIHSSLSGYDKHKKHRSVLKRYERIKTLKEKDKWSDEDSPFGLPKLKILKIKVKKEKQAALALAPEGLATAAKTAAEKPLAGETKKKTEKRA